jgi:ABC-type arginine/histidine transport system permease subunit
MQKFWDQNCGTSPFTLFRAIRAVSGEVVMYVAGSAVTKVSTIFLNREVELFSKAILKEHVQGSF